MNPLRQSSFVDELPRVGAIEPAHAHCRNELRIKVPEVHAVLAAWRGLQRLPVGDASTCLAENGPQRPVTPDVLSGGFRVGFDLHRAKLEVNPRPTDAPALRAVAVCSHLWRRGQRHPNCPTVTRALMHVQSPSMDG